jgi:hypothetical protein
VFVLVSERLAGGKPVLRLLDRQGDGTGPQELEAIVKGLPDDGHYVVYRLDYAIGFDLDDSRRNPEFAARLREGFEEEERRHVDSARSGLPAA